MSTPKDHDPKTPYHPASAGFLDNLRKIGIDPFGMKVWVSNAKPNGEFSVIFEKWNEQDFNAFLDGLKTPAERDIKITPGLKLPEHLARYADGGVLNIPEQDAETILRDMLERHGEYYVPADSKMFEERNAPSENPDSISDSDPSLEAMASMDRLEDILLRLQRAGRKLISRGVTVLVNEALDELNTLGEHVDAILDDTEEDDAASPEFDFSEGVPGIPLTVGRVRENDVRRIGEEFHRIADMLLSGKAEHLSGGIIINQEWETFEVQDEETGAFRLQPLQPIVSINSNLRLRTRP